MKVKKKAIRCLTLESDLSQSNTVLLSAYYCLLSNYIINQKLYKGRNRIMFAPSESYKMHLFDASSELKEGKEKKIL